MSSTAARKPHAEIPPPRTALAAPAGAAVAAMGKSGNRAGRPGRLPGGGGLRSQRAPPALHRRPDELQPEGLLRAHRAGAAPATRAFPHAEGPRDPSGRAPGARDPARAAVARQRPLERASVSACRRRFRDRSAGRVREPAPAAERALRRRAGESQGLAASRRGDLSPEDQRAPDSRGVPDLCRRRPRASPRARTPRRAGHEHPKHPLQGARCIHRRSRRAPSSRARERWTSAATRISSPSRMPG